MPKIKRERTRYHAKPILTSNHIDNPTLNLVDNDEKLLNTTLNKKKDLTNPVSNLNETIENSEKLAELKKDKRRQRHENWLKKLNQSYYSSKKKKSKSNIVMGSIKDALNQVNEEIENKESSGAGAKKITMNQRKNIALQEMVRFQNIIKLDQFKSNPLAAIQAHIKNTIPVNPNILSESEKAEEKMDE